MTIQVLHSPLKNYVRPEVLTEPGGEEMRFLLPMIFVAAGCATTQSPRLLTVEILEQARIACGAPDARLASDQHHLSIVLDGDSPDRPRQTKCLFERLHGQGYWFDQIVIQNARSAGPTQRPPAE